MTELFNHYLSAIFSVYSYYFKDPNSPHKCKSQIKADTIKCILIGSFFAINIRFLRGRTYYLKWIR